MPLYPRSCDELEQLLRENGFEALTGVVGEVCRGLSSPGVPLGITLYTSSRDDCWRALFQLLWLEGTVSRLEAPGYAGLKVEAGDDAVIAACREDGDENPDCILVAISA